MTHVLIIHGAYGNPQENWFPWLKKALTNLGHTVVTPAFPTPQDQTWENWRRIALKSLEQHEPGDTALIGHSIGATAALRLAEQAPFPYKAVIAASPFVHELGLQAFDAVNRTFVQPALDWTKVKRGAQQIICMAGDDDPYVPLNQSKEVASSLGVKLDIIPYGGHLNADAGFTEFPLLLNKLKNCL